MAFKNRVLKFADKYPFAFGAAFVVGFPIVADMVLTRASSMNGLGSVWTSSSTEIQPSGSTAPLKRSGTNNHDGIMP